MKPGYKQTEVGVIPEDWEVKNLGRCLTERPSYGINAPAVPYIDTLPVYIRITDIGENGRFSPDKLVSVKSKLSGNYYLKDGDIVFARTGASVGKSYKYNPNDGPLVFAGFLIRVRTDVEILLPDFAAAYVTTGNYWRWVRSMSMRSGQPGINGNEYSQLPIPTPTLPEQRAIATALSDVDALLAALERLIAKKRNLKQAAMQQLLTGKKRLPGFTGKWEVTTFGDVVRHHAGNSSLIKGKLSATDSAGLYPGYSASGQDVWCAHYEHEGFAIVVSAVGSRCGKAFTASGKWCAIANTHVVWPNASKVDSGFLGFFINDEDFWMKSGSGQPFVLFKQSFARPLKLPPLPEQTAIAAVLSDMDAELAALEQRRDKTRAIKQGMMQELLTGRTRLV